MSYVIYEIISTGFIPAVSVIKQERKYLYYQNNRENLCRELH